MRFILGSTATSIRLHGTRFRSSSFPVRLSMFLLAASVFPPAQGTPARAGGDPTELPLLHLEDFVYEGAFRLPAATYGESSLNFSEGPFTYDPASNSIFIVGHNHHQAIAEFEVPAIVASTVLGDLEMADPPLQPFETVLGRTSNGNPEDLNRIGGLMIVAGSNGPELIVNAYEYYDAPADNSQTTAALRDLLDLSGSPVDGFFTFEGGAGHTSGWMSAIPFEWQALLGGTHLTGQSSGIPIISRTSVGPSAFAFDPIGFMEDPDELISTATLLDFDLDHPLHDDLLNESRTNDLWTHLSRTTYGFIAPGSRTYATFGYSGGHESGVCYRCTQEDGNECGGYCAPDPDDYYQYCWLWDVNDLLAVRNGVLDPYEVRPYEYGEFPTPFENGTKQIGGGSFDAGSGFLYLTIQKADLEQGTYDNPPVVVAYRVPVPTTEVDSQADGIASALLSVPQPNPSSRHATIALSVERAQEVTVSLHDATGRRVKTIFRGSVSANHSERWTIDGTELASGVYIIRAHGPTFVRTSRLVVAD